jgi:hypothetical protein
MLSHFLAQRIVQIHGVFFQQELFMTGFTPGLIIGALKMATFGIKKCPLSAVFFYP